MTAPRDGPEGRVSPREFMSTLGNGSDVMLDVDFASLSIGLWSTWFPFSDTRAWQQGQAQASTTFDNFGQASALVDFAPPPILPSQIPQLGSLNLGPELGHGTPLLDGQQQTFPELDTLQYGIDRCKFISSDSTVQPGSDGQVALNTTTIADAASTSHPDSVWDAQVVQTLSDRLDPLSPGLLDSHASSGISDIFLNRCFKTATDQQCAMYDVSSRKPIVAAVQNHAKSSVVKLSQKNPLTIIYEDGIKTVKESQPRTKRGVRRAKLTAKGSAIIASKRRTHEVCIKCKIARSECVGGTPCQRCVAAWKRRPDMTQQPCLKAHFIDIIELGSCNYVSQRITSHLTLDGVNRRSVNIPEFFDLNNLLQSVQARQGLFNFRRRKMEQKLFIIDLAELSGVLKGVSKHAGERDIKTFREFIDLTLLDSPNWRSSVKECEGMNDPLTLLVVSNNEPCRASYDMVPIGGEPRPLDVESEEDVEEIVLAATLSRIICRKIELDGYRVLQKKINNLRFETSENATQFARQMGQILLTLRWRLSWWDVYGDGRKDPDPGRLLYAERVRRLTMVLYFYFFSTKRSISSWLNPSGIDGVWNEYADTLPMWDDFPTVESIEGMHEWLEKGKVLVTEASNKRVPQMK